MNCADKLACSSIAMRSALNYYQWIYRTFSGAIGESILEIGAGVGTFSSLLQDRRRLVVIDILEDAVEMLKKLYGNKRNITILRADICDEEIIRLGEVYKFDTVICLNVLEHIADDTKALSNIYRLLKQAGGHTGKLLLLAPAHQFLFGTLDQLGGHYRRYGKKELREKLERAGFEVKEMRYLNSLGAVAWFINYKVFRVKEIVCKNVERQITVFDRMIVPLLSRIERVVPPPFGTSLTAICEIR